MLTYIPVSFSFFKKEFGLGLKIGLGLGRVLVLGFGDLLQVGGAAATADPCGRKTRLCKQTENK